MRLTVWEKLYFKSVLTCSNLVKTFHTCSYLFPPVHTCSHLSCYSLFVQWQIFIELSPCESCYFSILRPILLKLHIFAHLIESYSTVSDLSSCIENKISFPQAAHTTVTMYARRAMACFCPFEGSHSSVLRPILLKLHILTRLIESFPTLYGL